MSDRPEGDTVVRWGVIGPGGIAARFADAMRHVDDGRIVAVASRSLERAEAFADRYDVERRYGDGDDLAADDTVDAVYLATPNSRHAADTLRFLRAGKHVLCEKPFALDASEAVAMADEARARGRFLMEAIWSRFLPSYRALVDLVGGGRIGDPQLVEGDFGFRMPIDPAHRLFDAELGGGALLDLGIYPVQLCTLLLGPVERVAAGGVIGPTGVDEQVAAVLGHAGGALGVVKAAIRVDLACTGRVIGTEGSIDLPAFMHCPDSLTVHTGGSTERVDASYEGDGLRFEIAEVHRCLGRGWTESLTMPLADTIALARVLDEIRAQLVGGPGGSLASTS